MAYVTVPKDLTKVKSKVVFGLTKRQLICFGGALLVGVPLFFLIRGRVPTSAAALSMVFAMLPGFLLALYEKHGQPLEVVVRQIVECCFIQPKERPYQTNNAYRFEAYESLQEAGLAVDRQNYDLIYTAPLDGKTTLEDIYRTFNLDRPADFTGHSLSVSDVVVLNRSGKEEAHYCDSFGFTPVPEFFLQREKQLTPRELLTGESIQTPRGSFLVTDMSREQLEAAGYGFHHQSEDGKYLIMGNGTDAFAIPAQQESPIKAAEMTTEQNYNMIDGVLNNAPTMSELEAKAKAGEQISLFDVAEAAKAEAQKPKQPQRPAQKQKKPSIRAQLKAAKEDQQKKPPQREKAQELEV